MRLTAALFAAIHSVSCASHGPALTKAPVITPAAATGKKESGIASIYHDRRTASGERFNPKALTAAHRTLPFGTRVKVTALRTGKSTIVRINDRGPFIRGRVIDLSPAAANSIGLTKGMGITKVEVQRL
jgi:rare lipoprotein A